MSRGAGPWRRWVDILATKESGTVLALARIFLGLVCLHTVADVWLTGVETWVWVDKLDGGVIKIGKGHWLIKLLGGAGLETTRTLMGLAAGGAVSLILGFGHRLGALVALQAFIALFAMNPMCGGGHDRLITNGLWLILLAPASETLSLWCRLRRGRWTSERLVVAWPRYLLVFQLALMYGITGLQKLGPAWMPWGDFSAIYRAVLMPTWARADWSAVAWVYPLTQLATIMTWLWEFTWPAVLLALWFRRDRTRAGWLRATFNRLDVRAIYVVVGLCMHGTVEILMNVGPFSLMSLTYYIACFHPDEVHRWGRKLRDRIRPTAAA